MTSLCLSRIAALVSVALGASYALGCSDAGASANPASDAASVVDGGGPVANDAGATPNDASVATDAGASCG